MSRGISRGLISSRSNIRWLISGGLIAELISGGIYPGAYIRVTYIRRTYSRGFYSGHISRGIYLGAYIRGTYIWVPLPGQISGGLIYGKLYLEHLYPVAYIRGLTSGGLYPGGLYPGLIYLSIGSLRQPLTKSLKKTVCSRAREKDSCYTESIQRAALLKGRSSGAILRLREAINSPKWYHAWVKLVPESFGMFGGPQ